tara:strand:- start:233 stop:520 length:288 start_codon:yes stop_codon:yes gene_type:complete
MIIEILLSLTIIYSIIISCLIVAALKRINQYENFIIKFQQIIEYSTERMKSIDALGHYESDDETGFFFTQLKDLQLLLNDLFETEEENEKDKEKK